MSHDVVCTGARAGRELARVPGELRRSRSDDDLKLTGSTQAAESGSTLRRLIYKNFQSNCWANLHILGQSYEILPYLDVSRDSTTAF